MLKQIDATETVRETTERKVPTRMWETDDGVVWPDRDRWRADEWEWALQKTFGKAISRGCAQIFIGGTGRSHSDKRFECGTTICFNGQEELDRFCNVQFLCVPWNKNVRLNCWKVPEALRKAPIGEPVLLVWAVEDEGIWVNVNFKWFTGKDIDAMQKQREHEAQVLRNLQWRFRPAP